jgi:hypothetical protein
MDWITSLTGPLVGILLVPLIGVLVALGARQLKKVGLELTAAQEARLRQLALDAVRAIEEQARRTPTISSTEKAHKATTLVLTAAPEANPARVKTLIDAALPVVRAELQPVIIAPVTPATFGKGGA